MPQEERLLVHPNPNPDPDPDLTLTLTLTLTQVPTEERLLVQEYVDKPLLLDGRKFDIRLYVLVTSFDPLRCHVYEQGLTRLASRPYVEVGAEGGCDRPPT